MGCAQFFHRTIAAAGSENSVKIGFEYARFVTKEMQQIEPHLLDPDPDDVRSDLAETETGADHESSLVATSDEVRSIYSVCVCVSLCVHVRV